MSSTIDELKIKIETESKQANTEVDQLIQTLQSLHNGLKAIESVNFESVSKSIKTLNSAITTGTKASQNISNAVTKASNQLDKLSNSAKKNSKEVKEALVQMYDGLSPSDFSPSDYFSFNDVIPESIRNALDIDTKSFSSVSSGLKSAFSDATAKVEETGNALRVVISETEELGYTCNEASKQFVKLTKPSKTPIDADFKNVTDKLNEYSSATKEAAKNTEKLSKATKGASSNVGGLGHSFKTLIRYGLGIRSIYILVNKLRRGLVEGFQNLAQYDDTTNKSISAMSSALSQLKNSFAVAFSPLANFVLPLLASFINMISASLNALSRFIAMLTGKSTAIQSIAVASDYAASLNSGLSGASKGASDTADAIKDIEKAMNQLSIDELNVISPNTNSSSGGSGSGGSSGGSSGSGINPKDMFTTVEVDQASFEWLDKLKERFVELKDLFKEGFSIGIGDTSVFDRIGEYLLSLKESYASIFSDSGLQSSFNGMIDSLALNLGKTVGSFASVGASIGEAIIGGFSQYVSENKDEIADNFTNIFDNISELFDGIGDLSTGVAEFFGVLREDNSINVFKDLFKIVGDLIGAFSRLASDILGDVGYALSSISTLAEPIAETFNGLIDTLSPILDTITGSISDVFTGVVGLYEEHISPLVRNVIDTITEVVKTVLDGYNQYIAPVIEDIGKFINELWTTTIQPVGTLVYGVITDLIDAVSEFWKSYLSPFVNFCASTIAPVVGAAFQILGSIGSGAFGLISSAIQVAVKIIGGFWNNVLKPLVKFINEKFKPVFNDVGSAIKNAFGGLKTFMDSTWSGVKDTINKMLGGVEGMVNGVISGINSMLDTLGKFSVKVPDNVPVIGGESVGFNVSGNISKISLPRFYNGGFPDMSSGSLFVAGENGRAEMLGTVGGKTAVASGQEITGISDAVYTTGQREEALLVTAINLLQTIANKEYQTNIGDEAIARASIRGQRKLGVRLRTT